VLVAEVRLDSMRTEKSANEGIGENEGKRWIVVMDSGCTARVSNFPMNEAPRSAGPVIYAAGAYVNALARIGFDAEAL